MVLAGVFALPFVVLYVSSLLFFPFITGKNFAFRLIVEIMFGAWAALAIIRSDYRPRMGWIVAAFGAFVAIMALADALGAVPFKSFWSNFERMEGWVTLAHLFAYIVVLVSVLREELIWKRLFQTSLGVSALVGIYGVLQLAGFLAIHQSTSRLDASLGNATYLAVYMLFHIFLGSLLLMRSWQEEGGRRFSTPEQLFYGGVILLDIFVLLFTETRGAILGLIGGAAFAALVQIVQAPRSPVAWRLGSALVGLALAAGIFLLIRDTALVQSVGPLQRLATISFSETTVKSRFLNAKMAWRGVEEHPLLGWGQENYALVFDKYYDPQMYGQEQWFDRTHNIIMDWLVAGGILGLAAYLSIWFAALAALWRGGAFAPYERSILMGLLAAYFFHNLFVFDNIISYILFAAVLGYIAFRAAPPTVAADTPKVQSGASYAIFGACAVATLALIWYVNAAAYAQNRTIIGAISAQQEGPALNLQLFKQAIGYGSLGTQEAREQLAQAATSVLQSQQLPAALKQEYFSTAVSELKKQASSSPLDARFPLFLGGLYRTAGMYDEAQSALAKARELSPTKQTIIFEQAVNALAREDEDGALALFKEAFDLAPEYDEARILYAVAAIQAGELDLAQSLIDPLLASGVLPDRRVLAAYVLTERFNALVRIFEAYVEKHPQDVQARISLAASLYEAGERGQAITMLEAIQDDAPQAAQQIDSIIEDMRAGTFSVQ